MNEKTIATYTTDKFRLQLLKITKEAAFIPYYRDNEGKTRGGRNYITKYQVRINRKIVQTSISEYEMRKQFAMYVQNQVLQLKIY